MFPGPEVPVSVGTLDQMIRRGDIPSIHVGGTRATRVSVADIHRSRE